MRMFLLHYGNGDFIYLFFLNIKYLIEWHGNDKIFFLYYSNDNSFLIKYPILC